MLKIDIVCVGKIKEKYYRDAAAEYIKRLSGYCRVQILEVADEPAPEGAGEKEEKLILEKEGERILRCLKEDAFVTALAIEGKKLTSEGLSAAIENLALKGKSHLAFVIGGSLGLSDQVMQRADFSLSFSDMTFPHQLMRVILLEQIYRSFRIMRHEPYHK